MKGLTYYNNYKHIVEWMNGDDYLPPPVEVNLDPFAYCNLDCYFCIVQRYLKHNRKELGKMLELPLNYTMRLAEFLADWGVRGFCISGGGEPTLYKGLPKLINHAAKMMDVSLFTNAVVWDIDLFRAMLKCKWISFSVDAATKETYEKVKGKNRFGTVCTSLMTISNLRKELKSDTWLVFKFLILPENQYEIYDACLLAKELGLQAIHIRPADFQRKDIEGNKPLELDIENIYEQFERCHDLENDNFRVFTVVHKFDPEFHVKHDFNSCLATPLVLPILSDGNAYLCVDHKMEERYKLGSCYPNPEQILEWWGSKAHRELVLGVNIDKCSRCTWSQYHQQIENVVVKDSMYVNFP
jgi:MoaA/NifB/PqqE/SkfB family radical SAM enzyme